MEALNQKRSSGYIIQVIRRLYEQTESKSRKNSSSYYSWENGVASDTLCRIIRRRI